MTKLGALGLTAVFAALLVFCGGCGYKDTYTPAGTPNLHTFAPGMWRMGQPPNSAAWDELRGIVGRPMRVVVVKLDDDKEGDDTPTENLYWTLIKIPLPPEDNLPWTVLAIPAKADVLRAVDVILEAHASGATVIWHCSHGRDRTGLVSALVGRRLFGWTKEQGWKDMVDHGFRWELPGLDTYWAEYGDAGKVKP